VIGLVENLNINKKDVVMSSIPRSGSTVSWQVIQMGSLERVDKYHSYIGGNSHVIYNIRHPKDIFLSLARIRQDHSEHIRDHDSILREMEKCCDDYERFIYDYKNGRPVCILRYEDWYGDVSKLIREISDFMSLEWTDSQILEVSRHCNIESNMNRAKGYKSFKQVEHTSHIHGDHIGPDIGRVNGWKSKPYSFNMLDQQIIDRIELLCERFGYQND